MPDFSYQTWLKAWRKGGSPKFPPVRWIVLVHWRDAAMADHIEDSGMIEAYTCGFLVDATSEELKVSLSVFNDQDPRDILAIPGKLITHVLEIIKLP